METVANPTILILGGIIGDRTRLLCSLEAKNARFVRIVDKFLIGEVSNVYLDPPAKKALNGGWLEYVQANLLNEESRSKAFELPTKYILERNGFDIVLDFTGESSSSAKPLIHLERTYQLSILCGKTAEKSHVGVYFRGLNEFYKVSSGKGRVGEVDISSIPWGVKTKMLHESLRSLSKLSKLKVVGIRTGIMYGPNTLTGITKTLLVAEIYKFRKSKMEFLWSESLPQSILHAEDFVTGILAIAKFSLTAQISELPVENLETTLESNALISTIEGAALLEDICSVPIFNLVSSTPTQKEISEIVAKVIDVKVGFHGSLISSMAKLNMDHMIEEVEERHEEGWMELLTSCTNEMDPLSPLSPLLPSEALQPFPIDISAERTMKLTGWKPAYPKLEKKHVLEMVEAFKKSGEWPIPGKRKK